MESKKLSLGLKTGYSVGVMGECIIVNLFVMYYLLFLTDAAGISPALAGTVATLITFWGAFADIFAGNISDKSKNPKGKRRPFIMKAAIPLGIVFVLMYADVTFLDENMMALYYIVVGVIGWQIFSFANIPFLSLGAELTPDYDERNSIRSITNTINGIGYLIISSGTILLLDIFAPGEGLTSPAAWMKMAIIFGVIIVVCLLITTKATKGKEQVVEAVAVENAPKVKFGKTVKELCKNKPFMVLMIYTIFGYGGGIVFTSSFMYYFTYVQGYMPETISLILVSFSILVIIFSLLIGKIASKFEKKTVLAVGALSAAIGFGIIFFGGTSLGVVAGYVMVVFIALTNSSYFVVAYSMLFDVCTLDTFKSGKDRSGTVISLFNFLNKALSGVALFVIGWALELTKYDPMLLEQTAEAQTGISILATLAPAIMFAFAAIVLIKYPINRNKFNSLQEAIVKKEEGKEFSTEGFEDIV